MQGLDAEFAQGLFGFLLNAEVQQVVVQLRTDQEFGGEISDVLLRVGPHGFHRRQIAHHQSITHRIAQRHVEVVAARGGCKFAEGEEQVLGHSIEHTLRIQPRPLRVGVAPGRREVQIDGLRGRRSHVDRKRGG